MRTGIIGLGNPILCDDGVGIRVARELEGKVNAANVDILETSLSGLRLLDLLSGYDRAIIIDAIETGRGTAGEIYRLAPDEIEAARHLSSVHDVDFATALDFGRKTGMPLPQHIVIFAVEAEDTSTFSEECTPEVCRAIPACVELVLRELNKDSQDYP